MLVPGIEITEIPVTDHMTWAFATFRDNQGTTATIELGRSRTDPGYDRTLADIVNTLSGLEIPNDTAIENLLGLDTASLQADFTLAQVVSAIRSAIFEFDCLHKGISLSKAMGSEDTDSVAIYANVNHSALRGRNPHHFARASALAVEDGFTIVKCAAFDYLPASPVENNTMDAAQYGLDQVAEVRRAVGPGIEVLIDCHSRFDEETAPEIARRLSEHGVGWFEEPLQPTTDLEALARVASQVDIPTAGGEDGYGSEFFRQLVESGASTIAMPDVKVCGGTAETHRAAMAATRAGGRVSLHGPSGPLSQLAGAHVTAATPNAMPLEYAANQIPWRSEVTTPPEHVHAGRLMLPTSPGTGATLDEKVVARRGKRWRI
jgi:galactonate dehydratase